MSYECIITQKANGIAINSFKDKNNIKITVFWFLSFALTISYFWVVSFDFGLKLIACHCNILITCGQQNITNIRYNT